MLFAQFGDYREPGDTALVPAMPGRPAAILEEAPGRLKV
jgi:hypothetical protein